MAFSIKMHCQALYERVKLIIMSSNVPAKYKNRGKVRISNILLFCFASWPLFWNLWVSFRITNGIRYTLPVEFLVFLCAVALLRAKRIKKDILLIWLLFIAAIAQSVVRGNISAAIPDMQVLISGLLLCSALHRMRFDASIAVRCVYICGLFVSVIVILDAVTGFVRTTLLPLYSTYGQEIISRRTATGGILPHEGSAGCFIYSGFFACISLHQKKRKSALKWTAQVIFVLACLLIQKRGFLLDFAFVFFAMWVLGWRFGREFRADLSRNIRRVGLFLLIVAGVILSREAFDSFFSRFTSNDVTLSGRTFLYELAFSFFKNQPFLGIGWGNYRAYTLGIFSLTSGTTFEVHNVYLQLLCETGIIGLAAFLIAVIATLVYGVKKYRGLLTACDRNERFYAVRFGLYLQFFFLAYCMSGNPLYDYNFLITYFIGVLLTL